MESKDRIFCETVFFVYSVYMPAALKDGACSLQNVAMEALFFILLL